ncbi:MAG: asparaginase, partial [Nocardiopsaceae bacterium]|nr:asparaginase [Nocardiopsaceae bacterium]
MLTGGTIGQRGAAGGAVPDADATAGLAAAHAPDGVLVRTEQVMERNSPDVSPRDWGTLADRVLRGLRQGADGIVILHGTDTLAYTAAALSFALRGVDRPVVLTGSMIPGSAPGSDAPANLRAAYAVAAAPLAGVCVVFGAPGGGADILPGT